MSRPAVADAIDRIFGSKTLKAALVLAVATFAYVEWHNHVREVRSQDMVGTWHWRHVAPTGEWSQDQTFTILSSGIAGRRGWSYWRPAPGKSDTAETLNMRGLYSWGVREPFRGPRQLCLWYSKDDFTPPIGCLPVHRSGDTLFWGDAVLTRIPDNSDQ